MCQQLRADILPEVVTNWNALNIEEQNTMNKVNFFFCGLHYLVALAEQAEASLKAYEMIIFKEQNHFQGKESGVQRLCRTFVKCLQERGCEKSGKTVDFITFMTDNYSSSKLPLAPFKGNRFNILFYNAAGTFFLHESAVKFFSESASADSNQLVKSVYHDLHIKQYIIGLQALGLIDKFLTGPLF